MSAVPERRDQVTTGVHEKAVAAGRQPHLALLHGSMLLSGFGTVFLGPLLPALAAGAQVTDSGSGLFFTAQFVGAFFGGVTTSSRLWLSLLRGSGTAACGFLLLALCTGRHAGLPWLLLALLPLGFGVGQMLTSVNLLASRRFSKGRGAALSLVNFSWSLGAVTAPFALGSLLSRVSLQTLLLCAGSLFVLAFLGTVWNSAGRGHDAHWGVPDVVAKQKLPPAAFAYFATLLLIYGGVETSLGGWITTFGTRYGSGALQSSALGATALWTGLTAGRALAPVLLRYVRERTLLKASLLAACVLTASLSRSDGWTIIVALCALLGLALAPWFPLVLSSMLGQSASASQVGTIIAVSGIGAATLPLLVGALSRGSGSLRTALLVPVCGLLVLLALSFRQHGVRVPQGPEQTPEGV